VRPRPEAVLDGSWEQPGRNPVWAGVAGLLLCGALYTTVGGIGLAIVTAAVSSHDWSWGRAGSFVDFLQHYYERFQVPILVVTAAMEFVIFFGLTFFLVWRWHSSRPARYLQYNPPAALDLVLAGLGAITVVPLAQLLDSWSYLLFPVLRDLRGGESALLTMHSPAQLVLVVFAVSVTPAICEEAIFRGWLQRTIRRRASAAVSILVTGALFALFHMSPLSVVALAFVGFYLGYLFERCGTLFASMTAHFLYNLTIIALINADPKWPWLMTSSGDFALPGMAGSIVVFALVVLGVELRGRAREAVLFSRKERPL
jgi:membrane protease YdiL (CAAX protease family)